VEFVERASWGLSCWERLLKKKNKLSSSMSLTEFDHGYWYAAELKDFAESIGIPFASKLRKDELEKAIKHFLRTGRIESPARRPVSRSGIKDVDRGLRLKLRVAVYTNDNETKSFLENEAQKLAPGLKRKSGARYRLNRWREEQLLSGVELTYGDLVNEYVRLCQTETTFARIPHGRYINFVSDFLASESNATREQAIKAWKQVKKLDAPKTYRSWLELRNPKSR
jgi:hypothetical protein